MKDLYELMNIYIFFWTRSSRGKYTEDYNIVSEDPTLRYFVPYEIGEAQSCKVVSC